MRGSWWTCVCTDRPCIALQSCHWTNDESHTDGTNVVFLSSVLGSLPTWSPCFGTPTLHVWGNKASCNFYAQTANLKECFLTVALSCSLFYWTHSHTVLLIISCNAKVPFFMCWSVQDTAPPLSWGNTYWKNVKTPFKFTSGTLFWNSHIKNMKHIKHVFVQRP